MNAKSDAFLAVQGVGLGTDLRYKAYRYRLSPTQDQSVLMTQWFGAKRFVWNKALALADTRLENGDYVPSFFEFNKMLTLWKQAEEWQFLKEAPKDIMQITLMDLEKSFKAMFDKKRKKMRKPKFKSKHNSYQAFTVIANVRVENNKIKIPKIKELIPFRRSRKVKGKVKSATISFDGRHWYVSILSEVEVLLKPITDAIGIDVGVKRFATMSDGSFIAPINFDQEVNKLHKHQITMARRVKGSARWLKTKTKVQKAYTRITNKRKDFTHKASTQLSTASMVCVEDLKINNMSASASGTIEEPGRMVAQKKGLNRAILAQGWGIFFDMLKYKTEDNGGIFIKVPPEYSSQECNQCGYTSKKNRLSQSKFVCLECGHRDNADKNASLNILARGQRVTARNKGGI